MVKVRAKVDQVSLKLVLGKLFRLIEDNIKVVLKTEAFPFLIDRIMEGYDELGQRAEQLPEDPTNPNLWRQEFKELLLKELEENFIVQGKTIFIRLGDKEVLGYTEDPDPDAVTPLIWLVYFIEGLAGEWAFIDRQTYDLVRGRGAFARLVNKGRFDKGFLISRENFELEGWDQVISFDQVRHPFSSFSPLDIFTEAVREFSLRPFIQKAIDNAVRGRRL